MKLDDNKIIKKRDKKIIYRNGKLCIKLFDSSFSTADILNEAANQAKVEETGLNVPKISEVKKIEGKLAIISEFIEGETLSDLIKKNPEKENDYMNLFADIHIDILSKHCKGLHRLRSKVDRKINDLDMEATTRYYLHNKLTDIPVFKAICHGDLVPSNIIINKEGTPYIIDWSHVTQGNATADITNTYLSLLLNGDNTKAEEYLNIIKAKEVFPPEEIDIWMPIIAASMYMTGNKTEDQKNILKEFIKRG